jgi:hypothetical protein
MRGKVLECLVSMIGIKANLDKIRAILQMQPPQTRKDVQTQIGRIAALNRFITKIAQWSLPFFTLLRGSTKMEWGLEHQKAFKDLKLYLQQLPTLSSPEQEQSLILYIVTTHSAVRGALVVEKKVAKDGKTMKQHFPIYFVSEVLTGSKRYYSEMEKICYAVVMSARKLHHYFEVHTIKVLTNQLLNDIFSNKDRSGWISKWEMEFSDYVVDFEKRSAIKS